MSYINLIQAIKKVAEANSEPWDGFETFSPDRGWHDDFTDEEWEANVKVPEGSAVTPDAVRAIMTEHLADLALNDVRISRAKAYPSLGDQLDKLFHDLENGTLDQTGEFFTAIKEVKDANPKPE